MSDPNNLVYRDQLDNNVIDMLSEDIGSNASLKTENQKTITAALNEIYGKDVIANAVGDPLLSTDTYNEMGRKLRDLTIKLKNKLLSNGITIAEYDKLNSLIEKIEVLGEGVGYGLEIVTGECNDLNGIDAARSWYEFHIDYDFGFTPNRILFYSTSTYFCELDNDSRLTIDSKYCYSEDTCFWFRGRSDGGAQQHYKFYIDNITSTGFSIFIYATSSSTTKLIGNKFDALGDGSSALLDTLKDILINKGVEVTGTESLAELIVKVDKINVNEDLELYRYGVDCIKNSDGWTMTTSSTNTSYYNYEQQENSIYLYLRTYRTDYIRIFENKQLNLNLYSRVFIEISNFSSDTSSKPLICIFIKDNVSGEITKISHRISITDTNSYYGFSIDISTYNIDNGSIGLGLQPSSNGSSANIEGECNITRIVLIK